MMMSLETMRISQVPQLHNGVPGFYGHRLMMLKSCVLDKSVGA